MLQSKLEAEWGFEPESLTSSSSGIPLPQSGKASGGRNARPWALWIFSLELEVARELGEDGWTDGTALGCTGEGEGQVSGKWKLGHPGPQAVGAAQK